MPLIDLLIADDSDAASIGAATCPLDAYPGIDAKGIDQVKLSKLYQIASGTDCDSASIMAFVRKFNQLHENSDDGPWVYRVPEELVNLLVTLDDAKQVDVARSWAAIKEFQLDRWPSSAVAEFLGEVCGLARQAVAQGKGIVMWMCL